MNEINDVLEEIVKDIEKFDNIKEKTYYNGKVIMGTEINKSVKKSFRKGEKMGIYMFAYKEGNKLYFLKIGKANSKSTSRFYNDHYKLNVANSTLAKKMVRSLSLEDEKTWESNLSSEDKVLYKKLQDIPDLKDVATELNKQYNKETKRFKNDNNEIANWMKKNLTRIDIILDKNLNTFVLNYFEAYLHLQFRPLYEGYTTQVH